MGREVPPEAARLRTAGLEAPRLAKLSVGGSASTSPTAARAYRSPMSSFKLEAWQLAAAGSEPASGTGTAPTVGAWGMASASAPHAGHSGAAPRRAGADSPGDGSEEADPRFLQMLAATLPPQSDGDCSGAEDGRGGVDAAASGAASLPDTIARLAALSGASSASAAAAPAVGHAAEANGGVGGKHRHKRGGFMSLFRTHSGKLEKQQLAAELHAVAAEATRSAGSESSSSGDGGKKKSKKKGSWFGGGGKSGAKRASAAAAGERPSISSKHGGSAVLLPGLPLTELAAAGRRYSEHSLGGSSTADGSAMAAEEGSPAVFGASPALVGTLPPGSPLVSRLAKTSASEWSAPSTAKPSPAAPQLGLSPAADLAASAAAPKPTHRRQHSLSSLLAGGWRRRSRTASAGSESELGGHVTPAQHSNGPSRAGSPAPAAAQALAAAAGLSLATSASAEMAGMPPVIVEEPPPLLPPGLTGIRNIGNTCFVNAALQCLRYTPGLAVQVVPDLLEQAARLEQRKQGGGGGGDVAGGGGADGGAAAVSSPSGVMLGPAEDVHQQAMARVSSDFGIAAQQVQQQVQQEQAAGAAGPGVDAEAEVAPEAAAAAGEAEEQAPAAAGGEAAAAAEEQGEAAAGEGALDGQATGESDCSPDEQQRQQQQEEEEQPAQHAQQAEQAEPQPQPQQAQQPAAPAKPQRPPRGALLQAFAQVVRDLYLPPSAGSAVCAAPLLRTLRAFPIAADYFDGGQHDCQEVLRVLMDLLHEDMNRVQRPQPQQQQQRRLEEQTEGQPEDGTAEGGQAATAEQLRQEEVLPAAAGAAPSEVVEPQAGEAEGEGEKRAEVEDEAGKADRVWQQQLERDSSAITDLFGGQLQSSVTCHKCGGRFTMYEPFWDLSLPLVKDGKGGGLSWLGLKGTPASIQDCLAAFTADEKLEGVEAFHCEKCGEKTPATKHLRIHRFPEVLVLQIKRFKYKGTSTDKLTANVAFPLKDLRLHQYASPECPAGPGECSYELYAVSNHYGTLSGGHYTAMCRVPQAGGGDAWFSFNDEQVTRVSPSQVTSQYAYILFYVRSRSSSAAAAAAEASRQHHRRTASAASAGAGGSAV